MRKIPQNHIAHFAYHVIKTIVAPHGIFRLVENRLYRLIKTPIRNAGIIHYALFCKQNNGLQCACSVDVSRIFLYFSIF